MCTLSNLQVSLFTHARVIYGQLFLNTKILQLSLTLIISEINQMTFTKSTYQVEISIEATDILASVETLTTMIIFH